MFESTVAKKFKLNQRVKFTTHYHPWMLVGGAFVLKFACVDNGRIYLVRCDVCVMWRIHVGDDDSFVRVTWGVYVFHVAHSHDAWHDSRDMTHERDVTHERSRTWHDSLIQTLNSEMDAAVDDELVRELLMRDMTHATWLTNVTWLTHPDTQRWDGFGSWSWPSHGTANAWHDSRDMTHVTWLTKRDMTHSSRYSIVRWIPQLMMIESRNFGCDMTHVTCLTWRASRTCHDSRMWHDSLVLTLNGEMDTAVDEWVTELLMGDMPHEQDLTRLSRNSSVR